jgi:RND family efflux transporter MFP subunit
MSNNYQIDRLGMKMTENRTNNMLTEEQPAPSRKPRLVVRVVLSLVILIIGVGASFYLKNSAPRTPKRPPAKLSPPVQVEILHPSEYQIVVAAMGTVIPKWEVMLKSRVSGEIVDIHPEFTEGGFLKKGMNILKIDPLDYEIALVQKKSAVKDAEYALKLELGHQVVAKREWELLNGSQPAQDKEVELALRKPHLEKAKADLEAAAADLKAAMLDLERTRIIAPFNAMVRSKSVDIGSQVTSQEPLAELVGTDAYRIQASIPIDRLEWIQIPDKVGGPGATVRIIYGQGYERVGKVTRLMGDLATQGRMARVLIEVTDPLGLKDSLKDRKPLLIGDYVRVEIQGHKLERVFQVPRTALRDNSHVWIVGDDQTLEIRTVHPVWRDADIVLLQDDLSPGERLIVSDLPAALEGMPVQMETLETGLKKN